MRKEFILSVQKTYLIVDAMYYHMATQSFEQAKSFTKVIERADQRVRKLQQKWQYADKKYMDDAATRYNHQERLAIQMESADYDVGVAYGPYLQALASTHVMSVAALEGHINSRVKEFLKGKYYTQFERITLETKWLLLPRILGVQGFDPGAQPYQGFAKLISIRNELVHYKEREEDWQRSGSAVPFFLKKLGLTLESAAQSLESVQSMIKSLSEQLKQEVPYWLRVNDISYFGFRAN